MSFWKQQVSHPMLIMQCIIMILLFLNIATSSRVPLMLWYCSRRYYSYAGFTSSLRARWLKYSYNDRLLMTPDGSDSSYECHPTQPDVLLGIEACMLANHSCATRVHQMLSSGGSTRLNAIAVTLQQLTRGPVDEYYSIIIPQNAASHNYKEKQWQQS